jgi:hypothetical protein
MINIPVLLKTFHCGTYLVKIIADSSSFHDEVHKQIQVKAQFPSEVSSNFYFFQDSSSSPQLAQSSQSMDITKSFSISLPRGIIDAKIWLSIYPNFISHILDGIEANLAYPYGCVEQLISALMPNLGFYSYLQHNQLLTNPSFHSLVDKLRRHIITGFLKLQILQNPDGGFGWWANSPSTILTTILVIKGYFLLHSTGFLVETWSLVSALKYLFNQINYSSYQWEISLKTPPWWMKMHSSLSFTIMIIGFLIEYNISSFLSREHLFLFQKAIESIISAPWDQITDCFALSYLYPIFLQKSPENLPSIREMIYKYKIDSHWFAGSAIGTEVETTARLTQILWLDHQITDSERDTILEWIYKQKTSQGGWATTADTRAVVDLLCTMPIPTRSEYSLEILCNNQKIGDVYNISETDGAQTSYLLQYIPLNSFLQPFSLGDSPQLKTPNLKESIEKNSLQVIVHGSGNPLIKIGQEIWIDRPILPMKGLSINRINKIHQNQNKISILVETTLSYMIPIDCDKIVIIEEPLPPATRCDLRNLEKLVQEGKIVGYQQMGQYLAFFIPAGQVEGSFSYNLFFIKKYKGSQPPSRIYPMYAPHQRAYGNQTHYNIN